MPNIVSLVTLSPHPWSRASIPYLFSFSSATKTSQLSVPLNPATCLSLVLLTKARMIIFQSQMSNNQMHRLVILVSTATQGSSCHPGERCVLTKSKPPTCTHSITMQGMLPDLNQSGIFGKTVCFVICGLNICVRPVVFYKLPLL